MGGEAPGPDGRGREEHGRGDEQGENAERSGHAHAVDKAGNRRFAALAEHLGDEPEDAGAGAPRVARQAGLHAGLREERVGVPLPFDGDLRQQQPAPEAPLDDQAVAADDDPGWVGRIHGLERPEHGDLEIDQAELGQPERREARVLEGGRRRHARDRLGHRAVGLERADAAAQLTALLYFL